VTNPQSSDSARIRHIGPIRNDLCIRRRTRPSTPCQVEPCREKSRRRRQYLVHPPQSRDLGPQTLQLRHRVLSRLLGLRRDRGVCLVAPTAQRLQPPRSLAIRSIALNFGVYLVPFAMVPSSPIELGEMWNNNQFISDRGHRHGEIQVHRALSFLGTGQYDNPFIQSPRKRPQSLIDAK
jgi:hypothetical protein